MENLLLSKVSKRDIIKDRDTEIERLNMYFIASGINYIIKGNKIPSKKEWRKLTEGKENMFYYLTFRPLNEINTMLREKIMYDKRVKHELDN